MLAALVLLPLLGAAIAAAVPSNRARPWLVPLVGSAHVIVTAIVLLRGVSDGAWLGLDALGKVMLIQVSGVFAVASLYAGPYLLSRQDRDNRVFTTALCALLAMMTLAITARHLGLMWVALEAATLAAAPLLYFNRNPRSIEATWKYLLVGSVGVAIALLGSFFLAYSALQAGHESTLLFDDLLLQAPTLSRPWLHGALVLLFVGYGTKMGLAPMHTWKPDAYGEAPGLVGTLLASGLTACALSAVLRFHRIAVAAGEGEFSRELLLFAGLFSMAVAAAFMVRQRDFKRMLAWSSVEHMGILALGVGLGGAGTFAALLHSLANGFTKPVLFLSAGNIHRAYGSKNVDDVQGALHRTPWSAALFIVGLFAVTGAPPFGPFLSELTLLDAALQRGQLVPAALFLVFLFVVFLGMGSTVLAVTLGPDTGPPRRDTAVTAAPILVFLLLSAILGAALPTPLADLLHAAAASLEGA